MRGSSVEWDAGRRHVLKWREIAFASLCRSTAIVHIVVDGGGGVGSLLEARRGPGSATRNVNNDGFMNILTSGIPRVNCSAHVFLWAKDAISSMVAGQYS